MYLQAQICFANEAEALQIAFDRSRHCALESALVPELASPREFDVATAKLTPEEMRGKMRMSADISRHVAWLKGDLHMGFDAVFVHHIGPDQVRFIQAFGNEVLPALSRK